VTTTAESDGAAAIVGAICFFSADSIYISV